MLQNVALFLIIVSNIAILEGVSAGSALAAITQLTM